MSTQERKPEKPCYASLAKQTAEREELYGKVDPPGKSIPINVDPKEVPDACPEDAEIRAAVRSLRTGWTGNTRGLRAENIKAWLRGIEQEEAAAAATATTETGPNVHTGAEAVDTWRLFVRLITVIWQTGVVPQQMLWMVVVLIPKGTDDYRGIGLLDPLWKVIEVIIKEMLKCLMGL